jgi:hypothetical protein
LREESEEKERELEREGKLPTLGQLEGERARERVREWESERVKTLQRSGAPLLNTLALLRKICGGILSFVNMIFSQEA